MDGDPRNAIFNEFLTEFPDFYDAVILGDTVTQVALGSLSLTVAFNSSTYAISAAN